MKPLHDTASELEDATPPAPLPGLLAAAQVRRETARGRRWASHKRRALSARVLELRAALNAGLSRKELQEQLRQEGIKVSRWMLRDLLPPPEAPPAPDPDPMGNGLPPPASSTS